MVVLRNDSAYEMAALLHGPTTVDFVVPSGQFAEVDRLAPGTYELYVQLVNGDTDSHGFKAGPFRIIEGDGGYSQVVFQFGDGRRRA